MELAQRRAAAVGHGEGAAEGAAQPLQRKAAGMRKEAALAGTCKLFDALTNAHVVVLGLGGVGSWAAEALARSGVGAFGGWVRLWRVRR